MAGSSGQYFDAIEQAAEQWPELPPYQQHVVVPSLRREANAVFKQLDLNRNGVLDGKELDKLAEWMLARLVGPGKPPPSSRRVRKEGQRLLALMDTDRDGKISMEEFQAYMSRMLPAMLRVFLSRQQPQEEQLSPPSSPTKRAVTTVDSCTFAAELAKECQVTRARVQAVLHAHSVEARLAQVALKASQQIAGQ